MGPTGIKLEERTTIHLLWRKTQEFWFTTRTNWNNQVCESDILWQDICFHMFVVASVLLFSFMYKSTFLFWTRWYIGVYTLIEERFFVGFLCFSFFVKWHLSSFYTDVHLVETFVLNSISKTNKCILPLGFSIGVISLNSCAFVCCLGIRWYRSIWKSRCFITNISGGALA